MTSKPRPTVYAFMDESGDAGGNVHRGASPYFVVVFVETTEPETLCENLRDLRTKFNLPRRFEFRYHDTRMAWARGAFFTLFRSLDVRVRAAVVDKARLSSEARDWGRQEMYEYVLGEMVSRSARDELYMAVLVIDGQRESSAKPFIRGLRRRFDQIERAQKRGRIFKAIQLKEARREDGLQYADMVAGALAEELRHGTSAYRADVAAKMRLLLRLR